MNFHSQQLQTALASEDTEKDFHFPLCLLLLWLDVFIWKQCFMEKETVRGKVRGLRIKEICQIINKHQKAN